MADEPTSLPKTTTNGWFADKDRRKLVFEFYRQVITLDTACILLLLTLADKFLPKPVASGDLFKSIQPFLASFSTAFVAIGCLAFELFPFQTVSLDEHAKTIELPSNRLIRLIGASFYLLLFAAPYISVLLLLSGLVSMTGRVEKLLVPLSN